MTAPQDNNQFSSIGQFGASQTPQTRPSALSRFMGYARGFAFNSILLGGVVFVAEIVLAPEYKPSHLMGGYVGHVEKAEIAAKQDASTEYARRMAEAQAKANANAAIETEVARQQQQVAADSLSGQSSMAIIADWACAIGNMIPRDASGDWQDVGGALRSGCGASGKIRDNMAQEQARAARNGTAIEPREVTPRSVTSQAAPPS